MDIVPSSGGHREYGSLLEMNPFPEAREQSLHEIFERCTALPVQVLDLLAPVKHRVVQLTLGPKTPGPDVPMWAQLSYAEPTETHSHQILVEFHNFDPTNLPIYSRKWLFLDNGDYEEMDCKGDAMTTQSMNQRGILEVPRSTPEQVSENIVELLLKMGIETPNRRDAENQTQTCACIIS
jgi:hypothetical protein